MLYKRKKIFNLLVIPLQSEFSLEPMAFSVNHYLVTLPKNQLKSGRYVLAELLSLPFAGMNDEERRGQSKSAILVAVTDVTTEDDTTDEDSVNAGHQVAQQNQDIKICVFETNK